MKIALVTAHTPNWQTMADRTVPGKLEYASRHGYEIFQHTGNWIVYPEHHMGYEKVHYILKLLKERPDIEWVWWTGCDCLITNHNIKLETFLNVEDNIHFIVTKDSSGINADVFFIRNSPEGREYLDHIKEVHVPLNSEQAHMWDDERVPKWRSITKYLPQSTMNSYDLAYYPHMPHIDVLGGRGNWQIGDFVLQAVTGLCTGWTWEQIYDWKLGILDKHKYSVLR